MIKDTLHTEYVKALKEKNVFVKEVLTLVNANIRNKEIDVKHSLSEDEVVTVISKEIKQLKETLSFAEKENRTEISEPCKIKITFLEQFMPKMLSEEEVKATLSSLFSENKPANKGLAMKLAMQTLRGKADGKVISNCVDTLL